MRLFSNPRSADEGEISALACFETLVAMAITVAVGVLRHDWTHVAVAVSVAPFVLLRTHLATLTAVRWTDKVGLWLIRLRIRARKRSPAYLLIVSPVVDLGLVVMPLAIRTVTLVVAAVCHPMSAIKAIPVNWRRFTLATDFAHPPEVIPGHWRYGAKNSPYHWSWVRGWAFLPPRDNYDLLDLFRTLMNSLLFPLSLLILYLPAVLFRMSLKSTCVVYLPVLWLLSASPQALDPRRRLEFIKENELEKLRRRYSVGALVLFYIAPILFVSLFNKQIGLLHNYLGQNADLISIYTFLFTVRPWHIVRLVNILLTFYLFLYADSRLQRFRSGASVSQSGLDRILPGILWVRRAGGLYTLVCSLYILYTTVDLRVAFDWGIFPF